jgi:hypothetical protein
LAISLKNRKQGIIGEFRPAKANNNKKGNYLPAKPQGKNALE